MICRSCGASLYRRSWCHAQGLIMCIECAYECVPRAMTFAATMGWRALLLACLLAGGMGGCAAAGHSPVYEVHVSPQWGPRSQGQIRQALSDWTDAVGVQFDVSVDDVGCDADLCIEFAAPASLLSTEQSCGVVAPCLGCSSHHTITLDYSPGHPEGEAWMQVLRHEIGHQLGLVHVQSTGAVMYPTTNASLTITREDVAQYESLHP